MQVQTISALACDVANRQMQMFLILLLMQTLRAGNPLGSERSHLCIKCAHTFELLYVDVQHFMALSFVWSASFLHAQTAFVHIAVEA